MLLFGCGFVEFVWTFDCLLCCVVMARLWWVVGLLLVCLQLLVLRILLCFGFVSLLFSLWLVVGCVCVSVYLGASWLIVLVIISYVY